MASHWTPTPTGVRRRTTGSNRAASVAAGSLTVVGTTLALLIAAAMLLPGTDGGDGARVAAASPTAPGAAPVVGPSASPQAVSVAPTQSVAAASPVPGRTLAASSPAPSARPDPATSPTPALAQLRQAVPLTVAGREIGRVTVQAVREVRGTSVGIPAGQRLMVASIRLDSGIARLPYDELHWRLEDENGDRWEPVAQAAPDPLGSGTLAPAAGRTGGVAFVMPVGVRVRAVVLTDGSGADLLVFSRPSVSG